MLKAFFSRRPATVADVMRPLTDIHANLAKLQSRAGDDADRAHEAARVALSAKSDAIALAKEAEVAWTTLGAFLPR